MAKRQKKQKHPAEQYINDLKNEAQQDEKTVKAFSDPRCFPKLKDVWPTEKARRL